MCDYKKIVGSVLKNTDKEGNITEIKITGYEVDYDDMFRQTDGHAGYLIHTITLDNGNTFTFNRIIELFNKYGELIQS
tara:strand:- start:467 stop:700 length:234 start_codon:yes stop_codon:yes gene_type:complete